MSWTLQKRKVRKTVGVVLAVIRSQNRGRKWDCFSTYIQLPWSISEEKAAQNNQQSPLMNAYFQLTGKVLRHVPIKGICQML